MDALNHMTFSAASDSLLKFWRFKTRKQEEVVELNAAPGRLTLHRDRWVWSARGARPGI